MAQQRGSPQSCANSCQAASVGWIEFDWHKTVKYYLCQSCWDHHLSLPAHILRKQLLSAASPQGPEPSCNPKECILLWGAGVSIEHVKDCKWVAWNKARQTPKDAESKGLSPQVTARWETCEAHVGESYYNVVHLPEYKLECQMCKVRWCAGEGHPPNHVNVTGRVDPKHTPGCGQKHCGTYGP